MKRLAAKVYASRVEYVDPADCGSTIGYRIHGRRYLSADVELSDCNRMINWYFNNEDGGLAKIDRAIEILIAFRNDFVKARKTFNARRPRRKK